MLKKQVGTRICELMRRKATNTESCVVILKNGYALSDEKVRKNCTREESLQDSWNIYQIEISQMRNKIAVLCMEKNRAPHTKTFAVT